MGKSHRISAKALALVLTALLLAFVWKPFESLAAKQTLSLTADATYTSEQLEAYYSVKLNGHKLTIPGDLNLTIPLTTGANGELVVKGNMTSSKEVDCNGGLITVTGSYTQTANRLACGTSGAKITIGTDISFQNTGYMNITSSGCNIVVGGNLCYTSTSNVSYNSGVWTVSGNVMQSVNTGSYKTGNLILNGTGTQVLNLLSNSTMAGLTANNSDVVVAGYMNDVTLKSDFTPAMDHALDSNGIDLNGHKLVLPKGLSISKKLTLGKNGNLIVNGDVNSTASISCSGGTMTIEGSMAQSANNITVATGASCSVTIKKSLEFSGTGSMSLESANARFVVGENLYYDSVTNVPYNKAYWTIAGDIRHNNNSGTFRAGNLILNGTEEQTLTLQNNCFVQSINAINPSVYLSGCLNHTTLKSDFAPKFTYMMVVEDLDLNGHKLTVNGNLSVSDSLTIGKTGELIVNGDLSTTGCINCTDGTLTVKGYYYQSADYLSVSGGNATISIGSNATFDDTSYVYITSSNAKITIGENLNYNSSHQISYNNATWTVLGDVKQGNGASFKANKLVMPNAGSEITLDQDCINTLILGNGKSHYQITNEKCCKKLIATVKMNFDPAGGVVGIESKQVTTGEKFGELPPANRAASQFLGWFTDETSDEMIDPDAISDKVDDFTAYARWNTMNFEDVAAGAWYFNAVEYVYFHSIMSGKGKVFQPNAPLTREEFTQVLYNHKGKPNVTYNYVFPDVKDAWYKKSVLWAKENDIANGKGDGTFGVGANISRQELALMLYKYAKLCGFDLTATEGLIEQYADYNKVESWAKNAMNWAVTQGIMTGKGKANADISTYRLDPRGNATRAECASLMKKLLEKNGQ